MLLPLHPGFIYLYLLREKISALFPFSDSSHRHGYRNAALFRLDGIYRNGSAVMPAYYHRNLKKCCQTLKRIQKHIEKDKFKRQKPVPY